MHAQLSTSSVARSLKTGKTEPSSTSLCVGAVKSLAILPERACLSEISLLPNVFDIRVIYMILPYH